MNNYSVWNRHIKVCAINIVSYSLLGFESPRTAAISSVLPVFGIFFTGRPLSTDSSNTAAANKTAAAKACQSNKSTHDEATHDSYSSENSTSSEYQWLEYRFKKGDYSEGKRKQLIQFFTAFYSSYNKSLKTDNINTTTVEPSTPESTKTTTKSVDIKYSKDPSNRYKYSQNVYSELRNLKERIKERTKEGKSSSEDLKLTQEKIEMMTMHFDESNIFKEGSKIFNILLRHEINCKEFVFNSISEKIRDLRQTPTEMEKDEDFLFRELEDFIDSFGELTMEAIIVHVMSTVFNRVDNSSPIVRASILLQRLNDCVRAHAFSKRGGRRIDALLDSIYCNNTLPLVEENTPPNDSSSKMNNKVNLEFLFTNKFFLGAALISFMEKVDLIEFENLNLESSSGGYLVQEPSVKKKGDKYYIPSYLYARCKIQLSLLPMKLNLPMIWKPKDWALSKEAKDTRLRYPNQRPEFLSDLEGGYLTSSKITFMERFRLLSSSNLHNMFISFSHEAYPSRCGTRHKELCDLINYLQSQPFQINKPYLTQIRVKEDEYVNNGLLLPKFLSDLDKYDSIRAHLETFLLSCDLNIHKLTFNEIRAFLLIDIQRASFEQNMLELADAYADLKFYLPAFLDFRGRIYRSGIMHFHERDIARSLLLFADEDNNWAKRFPCRFDDKNSISIIYDTIETYLLAAANHFKSFKSSDLALSWLKEQGIINQRSHKNIFKYERTLKKGTPLLLKMYKNTIKMGKYSISKPALSFSSLISLAKDAKRPFQFVGTMLGLTYSSSEALLRITSSSPITHDASASAYQIMSFFTLDSNLAEHTNLCPAHPDSELKDVYSYIQKELLKMIKESEKPYPPLMLDSIEKILDRDTVKKLFMPMMYGKTKFTALDDIARKYKDLYGQTVCTEVVNQAYLFHEKGFPTMSCLIKLLNKIGWYVSASGRRVVFCTEFLYTSQEYRQADRHKISIYDPSRKQRRSVTLVIPSEKPDTKKSGTATFVNFVHQTDASIAMRIIADMQKVKGEIYTVHDNFITPALHSRKVTKLYNKMFNSKMDSPLKTISIFLFLNVIYPLNPPREEYKYMNSIIPPEMLESYLINGIPKGHTTRFLKNIQIIVDVYKEYLTLMCGISFGSGYSEEDLREMHESKFTQFKNSISINSSDEDEDGRDLVYKSLHY